VLHGGDASTDGHNALLRERSPKGDESARGRLEPLGREGCAEQVEQFVVCESHHVSVSQSVRSP
jgi:hypothetical protein